MIASTVPDWLRGLWRRLSIETPDGQRDTQTQVFYLQTSSCFADLRLPFDRPDLRQASFSSLTQAEIVALSRQQGFAGITQFEQGQCQWVRYIDYQPPQSVRDIGLLYWQNNILIEEGVDQVYREEWHKVDDGDGDFTALVLAPDDTSGSVLTWQAGLVIAGDYFIYSHNRSVTLPAAETLSDFLMTSTTLQEQQDYVGCEISLGLCRSGRVPWEIQRSTIPWREGTALWSASELTIDWEHKRILQTSPQGEGCRVRESQIREWGTGKAFTI